MTTRIILCVMAFAWITACQSPKEKSLAKIKGMEAADSTFSPASLEELKAAYLDFATRYPDDEQSPEFIFKAAQRCNVLGQHEESIKLFQSVCSKYPNSGIAEEALFVQAYVYENELKDLAKARDTYNAFLKKYPASELAEDAQISIENLGKTPEEIFEGFKSKNSADSLKGGTKANP